LFHAAQQLLLIRVYLTPRARILHAQSEFLGRRRGIAPLLVLAGAACALVGGLLLAGVGFVAKQVLCYA
jgi:hypothetical protein